MRRLREISRFECDVRVLRTDGADDAADRDTRRARGVDGRGGTCRAQVRSQPRVAMGHVRLGGIGDRLAKEIEERTGKEAGPPREFVARFTITLT